MHDTDADYTIFVWRQKSSSPESSLNLSASSTTPPSPLTPTLHVHNPSAPLPAPPAYRNPSFYLFLPQPHLLSPEHAGSVKSSRSKGKSATSGKKKKGGGGNGGVREVETPQHKKDFEKFHSENGVRTVMGSIGPVQNGMFFPCPPPHPCLFSRPLPPFRKLTNSILSLPPRQRSKSACS